MPGMRDRLIDAGYGLGWSVVCRVPESWVAVGVPHRGGHRLAPPGPPGPGAGGQPAPGARPRCHRRGTARGVPGGDALLRPVLDGGLPAAGDPGAEADRAHRAHRPRRGRPRLSQVRPRRGVRAAAHGQLGLGRRLDHRRRGRLLYNGDGAAQAGVRLRQVRRLPRRPRHGGTARQRGSGEQVRDTVRAAAGGQARVPASRQGRHRRGHRGGVLRREGTDDGRLRRARPAHRRGDVPGARLWYEGDRLGIHVAPEIPVPARGGQKAQGGGDDAGSRVLLRGWYQAAPGRLAHAAAGLRRRP